jgi:septum formation protein
MHGRRVVLASGSRYRAQVLAEAGFDVVADPPEVDERAHDDLFAVDPAALALLLAELKATDVAPRHPASVVLAGDQIGVLDRAGGPCQLTKQADEDAAVEQLMSMSGSSHSLVNGIVVLATGRTGRIVGSARGTDVQRVTMRSFTEPEARSYVRRFRPFDSAGSYRLEDQELMSGQDAFVVDVQGEDPSGVLGLPVPLVRRLLDELDEI